MSVARPRFSIIVPVGAGPAPDVIAAVDSLRAQSCTDWEALIVGAESDSVPASVLRDRRVRAVAPSAGAAADLDRALDSALGEFVAVLDPRDRLASTGLAAVSAAITRDVDVLYTDEDRPDAAGPPVVVAKPEWSPERFRHGDYVGGLLVVRTALARDVGGFDSRFAGASAYEFALRATERARRVVHVPAVAYHRAPREHPSAEDEAASRQAVQAHLSRLGIEASVLPGRAPGLHRIRRRDPEPEVTISIIMPTLGQRGAPWGEDRYLAVESVRSALAKTAHQDVEVIVVHDAPTPAEVLDQLREVAGERLVTVGYDAPFNFSEKCNLGFLHARGEVIVLLNDDVQVISEHWLETLVAPLREPDVGLTGARLLFPDGTLQHGGHVYAPKAGERPLRHAYHGAARDAPGELGSLLVNRECSGVTAACAALRRETYERVGGLTEQLPGNYNDVDLSLKVRYLGLRILWLADCELFHFESQTRNRKVHPQETGFIAARWGAFGTDPFTPGGR